jgi:membrane-associated phospholipid phosphatase
VHFIGMGGEYAIAIIILVIIGLIYKEFKSFLIAGELIAGPLAGGILTRGFKHAVGRCRPCNCSSPFEFFKDGRSFYSGDVCIAFIFATIISKEYPRQNLAFIGINRNIPVIPIFSYIAAGLVAFQRIYSNQHWASDVYVGSLVGIAIGSMFARYGRSLSDKKFARSKKADENLSL